MYTTRETRYYTYMNRYEILIDTDDLDALDAINELFTNVVVTTSPDSSTTFVVALDATDDLLVAYADRFDLTDELDADELFTFVA